MPAPTLRAQPAPRAATGPLVTSRAPARRAARGPRGASLAALLLTGLGTSTARAAPDSPERPDLPSLASAGEDGAPMVWTNPAALALDPDASGWLSWGQELGPSPGTLSGALQQGPLATGLSWRLGDDDQGWLSWTNGLGIRLDRRVALGLGLGWQIPEGPQNNFLTWDFGLAWRPAQWLGVALVAQNLNDPAPGRGVRPQFGGGVAWRPLDGRVSLGVDYRQDEITPDALGRFAGSARIEPTDGLVVRLYGDQDGEVGGGLELYWGRLGAGAHTRVKVDGAETPEGLAYLSTAEGMRSVFDTGRRAPEFILDGDFPYRPPTGLFAAPTETWLSLVQRMEAALADRSVRGIVLHVDQAPGSWARVAELRDILVRARAQGKVTVVYLDRTADNAAYALATAADRVYLHPAASLDLKGLAMELTYLRGTLDMIGVEPQFVRRSEFKSAPEQWTRSGPSEPARQQLEALLDAFHEGLIAAIAEGRGKERNHVARLVDLGPFTAAEAEERGLVDGLVYPDDLDETLEESWHRPFHLDPDYRLSDERSGWPAAREIAVVYVDGVITTGPSRTAGIFGAATAGSDTIVRQLDQARRDDAVQAVVLRVDSPGGSAFASDEIWRATRRVQDEGKPVVVSMGGVAASGGYYVAAGADAIYAEPETITGSIGVFGGKMSLGQLMEKVGVETEILSRGRHAAMDSGSRPWDASELEVIERLIDATYTQFKSRVAEGRGLTPEQVEEVARGRVWSGAEARRVGLVDEIGGLSAAIARAREEAGIPPRAAAEIVVYPDRPDGALASQAVGVARQGVAALLQPGAPPPGLRLPTAAAELATWSTLAQEPVLVLLPWRVELR